MDTLQDLLARGDYEAARTLMDEFGLVLTDDNRIAPRDDASRRAMEQRATFWDQRQLAR